VSNFNRDIILLLHDSAMQEREIELAVKNLHQMITAVETAEAFCEAHELVARNRITKKKFKIIDAISHKALKPFYFLINKN